MSTALHWGTLTAYILGAAVYLAYAFWQKKRLANMGRVVLWLGLALHSLGLIFIWIESGITPATSLRQSLDVLSWGLMGATLVVNLRRRVMILGAITAPLCTLLLLAAAVVPAPPGPPSPVFKSLWTPIHIFTVMIGYGLLALTFFGNLLYLFQERLIRAKQLGPWFQRLPSLSRLDDLNQRTLLAGFTFFTVGMISGAVFAQQVMGSYWRWDPKEVWSLITWLLYACLVHTRLAQGWRGRRGAWLAVAAFVALIITFVGAGIFFPGYHNFQVFTQPVGG